MCYFTAIGLKPKYESKIDVIKETHRVEPCKNPVITSYSESFKWFWIYDTGKHCSCGNFSKDCNLLEKLVSIVPETYSLLLLNHFFDDDPDGDKFEFSEQRITPDEINEEFEVPDDVLLKIVEEQDYSKPKWA